MFHRKSLTNTVYIAKNVQKEMARVARAEMNAHVSIGVKGTLSNVNLQNPNSRSGEVHYAVAFKEAVLISSPYASWIGLHRRSTLSRLCSRTCSIVWELLSLKTLSKQSQPACREPQKNSQFHEPGGDGLAV